jgi:hypothetical protein
VLTFQLKWACNLRVQHGVDILRPPVRATRIASPSGADRWAEGVHGVAVVTNGAGEGQERVPARTQAGPLRRVLVGIQAVVAVVAVAAVHGVVHLAGIFEFCSITESCCSAYI